eukprot:3855207-Prorocentrum_lima.AAC.1
MSENTWTTGGEHVRTHMDHRKENMSEKHMDHRRRTCHKTHGPPEENLSLIHISEPTRLDVI